TVLLAQRIGVARAKQMSITGNYVDAPTALTWGLVNHVVPHEELLPFCRQLAADIVSNDQAGVRQILATYDAGSLTTADEWWNLEVSTSREWMQKGGGSGEEVERRRAAIMARGREQVN
ncbi:MAG: enoyl-CoA hydratase, partial [Acidimicrobiaceae bacterium]